MYLLSFEVVLLVKTGEIAFNGSKFRRSSIDMEFPLCSCPYTDGISSTEIRTEYGNQVSD